MLWIYLVQETVIFDVDKRKITLIYLKLRAFLFRGDSLNKSKARKLLGFIITVKKALTSNSLTKPSTLSSSFLGADVFNVIKYTELALFEALLVPFHSNVNERKVFSITSAVLSSGVWGTMLAFTGTVAKYQKNITTIKINYSLNQYCEVKLTVQYGQIRTELVKLFFPANMYLLKVNNRNTRKRCEICSKLTINTQGRRQWRRSAVFIVNNK